MSDTINEAVKALNARMSGRSLTGSAKFVIADKGAVVVDAEGAHAGDSAADVTLSADVATFVAIIEGRLNPAKAYMSGKLAVEGDMSVAMQLGRVLG